MSRTLSKILIVCAMIAIFPLMIIGTAFAAYYSIDAKVNVAIYVNEVSASEDAFAQVVFDGKAHKAVSNFDIQGGHLNKVALNASAKGYDFKGWFVGNVENYATALQTDTVDYKAGTKEEVSFEMNKYTNLVAVFEIQTKDVSWKYVANPTESTTLTMTAPSGADNTFSYGEALPTLSYEGEEWTFLGWKANNDETIYTTANEDFFALEAVELSAVWKETEKTQINYFVNVEDTDALESTEIYINTEYAVKNVADFASIDMERGYRYFWKDATGVEVTQINTDAEVVNLYLDKALITYTANFVFENEDVEYVGESTIAFTKENPEVLNVLFDENNFKAKYSFWNVTVDKSFAETTYTTVEDLAKAIVDANPNNIASVEVLGVVSTQEKNYINVSVTSGLSFSAGVENKYTAKVYGSKLGNGVYEFDCEELTDSTTTVYDLLGMEEGDNVKTLYADINNDGTREVVVLKELTIVIGSKTYTVAVDGTETINDVLEKLMARADYTSVALGETFTISSINARFVAAE